MSEAVSNGDGSEGALLREDTDRFERRLAEVAAGAAGAVEGIYGPGSMTWRVYRESALFVAGLRALLLQIARPEVAAGVDQHSDFRADPVGRARRTFSLVYRLPFADLETAMRAARQIHARHRGVRGPVAAQAGALRYRANDPELLHWVHATLIESAELAYQALVEPLAAPEREQLYRESRTAATLFGIPDQVIPPDRTAFAAYFDAAVEQLEVGPTGRSLAEVLLRRLPGPPSLQAVLRAVTASLLPERLREPFGLPLDAPTRQLADRWLVRIGSAYRLLPGAVRFMPAYHEAVARVTGRGQRRAALRARVWDRLTVLAARGGA